MMDPALKSYFDKWLAAHPAQQATLTFIAPDDKITMQALAALELELVNAAFGLSEAQVAATKLKWWAEELTGAKISGGRHPLVQALFKAERVHALDTHLWLAPITQALNQLEYGTAANFDEQWQQTRLVFAGISALETHIWYGPDASNERAADMATLTHLLYTTTRLPELMEGERLPIPMATLARLGLTRDDLQQNDAREQVVHEQIAHLAQACRQAKTKSGPLSIFRGLDARLSAYWLNKGNAAKQPLQRLRQLQERQTGLRALRYAWASARQSRYHQLRQRR